MGVIRALPNVDDTVEIHVTERIHEQIGPERSEDQVGDIPIPPIVEEAVVMVQVIPRELFPERVDVRIVDFPVPPCSAYSCERMRGTSARCRSCDTSSRN